MKLYVIYDSYGLIVSIDTNRKSAQSFIDKFPGRFSLSVFKKLSGTSCFFLDRTKESL